MIEPRETSYSVSMDPSGRYSKHIKQQHPGRGYIRPPPAFLTVKLDMKIYTCCLTKRFYFLATSSQIIF